MLRCFFALILASILIGCATQNGPERECFGLRESLWNTLTNEQKDMVIQSYNKRQERLSKQK